MLLEILKYIDLYSQFLIFKDVAVPQQFRKSFWERLELVLAYSKFSIGKVGTRLEVCSGSNHVCFSFDICCFINASVSPKNFIFLQ